MHLGAVLVHYAVHGDALLPARHGGRGALPQLQLLAHADLRRRDVRLQAPKFLALLLAANGCT